MLLLLQLLKHHQVHHQVVYLLHLLEVEEVDITINPHLEMALMVDQVEEVHVVVQVVQEIHLQLVRHKEIMVEMDFLVMKVVVEELLQQELMEFQEQVQGQVVQVRL